MDIRRVNISDMRISKVQPPRGKLSMDVTIFATMPWQTMSYITAHLFHNGLVTQSPDLQNDFEKR